MPIATSLRKINFGCGYDKREGYLNVDVDPACEPDVLIVDDDYSVIPKNSFDEILANDVLEHIPRSRTSAVLLDWSEYLVVGGTLDVQTSSILGVAEQMTSASAFADQFGWTICLFGNQAHPGDFHFTGFTETTLRVHLLAVGFDVGEFTLDDGWLLGVRSHKRYAWSQVLVDTESAGDEEFIHELYRFAFDREPDGGAEYLRQGLANTSLTRDGAARHLLSSPERLFLTAQSNAL